MRHGPSSDTNVAPQSCSHQSKTMALAFVLLLSSTLCQASERKFDVKDDVFAFPQVRHVADTLSISARVQG